MKPASAPKSHDGLTLRQPALVAGSAYLLNPVSYAEFSIYPKLVVANNDDQTVQNISAHLAFLLARYSVMAAWWPERGMPSIYLMSDSDHHGM
jgi:hypothetical protein